MKPSWRITPRSGCKQRQAVAIGQNVNTLPRAGLATAWVSASPDAPEQLEPRRSPVSPDRSVRDTILRTRPVIRKLMGETGERPRKSLLTCQTLSSHRGYNAPRVQRTFPRLCLAPP